MTISPEGQSCSNCRVPLTATNWAGGLDCTGCVPTIRLRATLAKWKAKLPPAMRVEFERTSAWQPNEHVGSGVLGASSPGSEGVGAPRQLSQGPVRGAHPAKEILEPID